MNTTQSRQRYDTFMGRGPERIIHWEHWSNPVAASAITGIDYDKQPFSRIRKLNAHKVQSLAQHVNDGLWTASKILEITFL